MTPEEWEALEALAELRWSAFRAGITGNGIAWVEKEGKVSADFMQEAAQ